MATYAANSSTPPYLAPLDPDEVLEYVVDWSDWLNSGDAIAVSDWDVPTGIGIGDGATVVTTPAGDVTPAAPTLIATNTKAQAHLYVDGADDGTYVIENTVRTDAGLVGSRSFKVVVGDR